MKLRLLKRKLLNYKWKKKNRHNRTYLGDIVERTDCITVGNATYGEINLLATKADNRLVIGNYCSIARKVMFILHSEHDTEKISTFPFKAYLYKQNDAISKGDIIVKDDVWIGYNSIIMSGVTIGQGAVIGAGSIVTHDIPEYAIAAGVPARIIKYRFPKQIILKLNKIDYSKMDEKFIINHIDLFNSKVTDDIDIDIFPQK